MSIEQIGLIGSSTPFHSPDGSPFTLFYNGERSATGAVGIAIVGEDAAVPLRVDYPGLETLGEPVEVTRYVHICKWLKQPRTAADLPLASSAKGNIVLTLSEQNAARLLLNLVQEMPDTIAAQGKTATERGELKDKEFYAAVFETVPEVGVPLDLTKARHVSRIMAGDPSRGAMSVETEEDVRVGSYIVVSSESRLVHVAQVPPLTDTAQRNAVHAPLHLERAPVLNAAVRPRAALGPAVLLCAARDGRSACIK